MSDITLTARDTLTLQIDGVTPKDGWSPSALRQAAEGGWFFKLTEIANGGRNLTFRGEAPPPVLEPLKAPRTAWERSMEGIQQALERAEARMNEVLNTHNLRMFPEDIAELRAARASLRDHVKNFTDGVKAAQPFVQQERPSDSDLWAMVSQAERLYRALGRPPGELWTVRGVMEAATSRLEASEGINEGLTAAMRQAQAETESARAALAQARQEAEELRTQAQAVARVLQVPLGSLLGGFLVPLPVPILNEVAEALRFYGSRNDDGTVAKAARARLGHYFAGAKDKIAATPPKGGPSAIERFIPADKVPSPLALGPIYCDPAPRAARFADIE